MKQAFQITILLVLVAFLGCNQPSSNQIASDENESIAGADIQDTNALKIGIKTFIDSITNKNLGDSVLFHSGENSKINKSCTNPPLKREDLTGLKTVIKIYTGDKNQGISVPGFGGLKLGKSEISYNVYYIEPKVVPCGDTAEVFGCGYSLHLYIKKINRKLDVSKLPTIAASVQLENNKTDIYYSLETHGLSGTILVKFFKPVVNKPFDVEGFGIMQASIDGIHAILSDDSLSKMVKFSPVAVGFIRAEDLEQ